MEHIVFIIYILIFFIFVLLISKRFLINKLLIFKDLFKLAIEDAKILRDISLGGFVNGMFSVMNTHTLIGFVGYFALTIIALIGIINSNSKIIKDA